MTYRVTPRAERDLEEIGDFIALDNRERALTFILEIEQRFAQIAEQPNMYRNRDEILDGLRAAPHGRYLIFFLIDPAGQVEFVRVLHGARDVPALFPP